MESCCPGTHTQVLLTTGRYAMWPKTLLSDAIPGTSQQGTLLQIRANSSWQTASKIQNPGVLHSLPGLPWRTCARCALQMERRWHT